MKRILCFLLVGSVAVLPGCSRKETANTQVSPMEKRQAPEISISSLNGTQLKLSDLKGKVVMLNFWATWCPPCRSEIPSMMKLNSAMAGKPFQMLAVSIDEGGKPRIEAFLKDTGFDLPVYVDPTQNAAKTYGITGVPETFIIDKNGILVKKIIGPIEWDSPDAINFLQGLAK